MTSRLGVNLDQIAAFRQARGADSLDLVQSMRVIESGGADQVAVSLGERGSSIQADEVRLLRSEAKKEFRLQISPILQRVNFAVRIRPDWVCLLDLGKNIQNAEKVMTLLKRARIRVACSIQPKKNLIRACKRLGADAVEFQTHTYAAAFKGFAKGRSAGRPLAELDRLKKAGELAKSLGLHVHVRGSLNFQNVRLLAELDHDNIPFLEGYHIGHSIACRAVLVGLERAVREMVSAILAP